MKSERLCDRMRSIRKSIGDKITEQWSSIMTNFEKNDIVHYVMVSEEIGNALGLYGVDEFVNNTKSNGLDNFYDFLCKEKWSVALGHKTRHEAMDYYRNGGKIFSLEIFMKLFSNDWVEPWHNVTKRTCKELCNTIHEAIIKKHDHWLMEYFEEAYFSDCMDVMMGRAYKKIQLNTPCNPNMIQKPVNPNLYLPQAFNYRKKSRQEKANWQNCGELHTIHLFPLHNIKWISEETMNVVEQYLHCTKEDIVAFINLNDFMDYMKARVKDALWITQGKVLLE